MCHPRCACNELKESIVKNTTCLEKMVYSAIETTCFGLYWSSSGFYNIKKESIKAVKNCEGVLIKRSIDQSPDHSLPIARATCKHGEIYKQRKIHSAVSNTVARPGFKVYAAPRRIPPSPHRRVDFSLFINFSNFTNSSCTRNGVVRGLIYRSLNQHPSKFLQFL